MLNLPPSVPESHSDARDLECTRLNKIEIVVNGAHVKTSDAKRMCRCRAFDNQCSSESKEHRRA